MVRSLIAALTSAVAVASIYGYLISHEPGDWVMFMVGATPLICVGVFVGTAMGQTIGIFLEKQDDRYRKPATIEENELREQLRNNETESK